MFDEASDRAREQVRSAIVHLVADSAGDDAFHEVPIWPGARTTERRPEPHRGLQAALRLRTEVNGQVRQFVEQLRGSGVSWLDVAAQVRREAEVDVEQAGAVFEEFATGGEFDPPWMSWRCDTCGERVLDYGPYNPHPDDVETGHADDCGRNAADIRAYEMERTGGND